MPGFKNKQINFSMYLRRFFVPCIFFVLLLSCAEVPLTKRKGLHLISQSQLSSMSLQQYSNILKKSSLSNDRKKVAMVRRVGKRIAVAAETFMTDSGLAWKIREYHWEFNLIDDKKAVNAWCMPGGKVAVYTGILPVCRDETGLAVVMGHEIAHAIADHGNERMSHALITSMGGIALSIALAEKPSSTRNLFMTAYGAGAGIGFTLPYSRVHESEADRIGLVLMASAGYDPRKAIFFWQRMNAKGGPRPPEFLSTHPAPASRIEKIKFHIPEALSYYQKRRR